MNFQVTLTRDKSTNARLQAFTERRSICKSLYLYLLLLIAYKEPREALSLILIAGDTVSRRFHYYVTGNSCANDERSGPKHKMIQRSLPFRGVL